MSALPTFSPLPMTTAPHQRAPLAHLSAVESRARPRRLPPPPAAAPVTIATWLYAEPEAEQSLYPRVTGEGGSATDQFQAVYWRCAVASLATSRRTNAGAQHVFYTNLGALPTVDGHDLGALFAAWNVEVVRLPYSFLPPDGYYGQWRSQFYVFDILRHLAGRLADGDVAVLLDSDVVWARPADRLVAATRRAGALTYDVGLEPDLPEHGLTLLEMGALYAEVLGALGIDRPPPEAAPPYTGGEIVAATGATLRRLDALAGPLWAEMLRRHAAGLPRFYEESHALSFLYYALDILDGTANPFIRRIWTTLPESRPGAGDGGSDARPTDLALTLWHVPAEKRTGFRHLFEEVMRPRSAFWALAPGDAFRRHVGSFLGIPNPCLGALARGLAAGDGGSVLPVPLPG